MFGVSPVELLFVGIVALLVVGPDKLPGMLRSVGAGLAKLRRLTTDVRAQSGIDDILRAEGLSGGLDELRSLVRRGSAPMSGVARSIADAATTVPQRVRSTATAAVARVGSAAHLEDRSREYPVEGADAAGALPEDLLNPPEPEPESGSASANPETVASAEPSRSPEPTATTEPGESAVSSTEDPSPHRPVQGP